MSQSLNLLQCAFVAVSFITAIWLMDWALNLVWRVAKARVHRWWSL